MANCKRKALTLDDKVKIIRELENGRKKADICREFNLANSTVCTIWKDKTKVITAYENGTSNMKRIRKPVRDDLDEALLKWFKQQRSANVPLNGPILMAKAEELARLLKNEEFVCSNGWIDRFKLRHNIAFAKISGEANSVNEKTVTEWLSSVWPNVRNGYTDAEIFNADETALFYRLTPDKTLKFKQEKCVGGKHSKERITVLACANMDGTQKRMLTVIGKSKNPRCFRSVKSFPVRYRANKRAWMTSDLFREEMRQWDLELQKENKKVLLLVDNCPAHPEIQNLQKIKIVFLPANCTSKLQPLDQGVIRSLKCKYRKQVLMKIIECIDKKEDCVISLLDAIRFLDKAWRQVTEQTIKNCFRHAGFSCSVDPREREVNVIEDEDDLPLSKWLQTFPQMSLIQQTDNIDEFLNVDENLLTSEVVVQSDFDIVQEIKNRDGNSTSDEEEEVGPENSNEKIPSAKEALDAMKIVSLFYETREYDQRMRRNINAVEDDLEHIFWSSTGKQTKISDFFTK